MSTPLDRAVHGGTGRLFRDEEERSTFLRRLKRSLKREVKQSTVEEFLESALRIDTHKDNFPFSLQNLEKLVESNPESKTAMGLLQSAVCCVIGHDAIDSGDFETAASAFAEAYRKNSMVVRWDFRTIPAAQEVFHALFSDASGTTSQRIRAEAMFVHANLCFLQGKHPQGIKEIQLAQLLLPEDPYFPAREGCVWAMLMKKDKARKAFQKAADLGCDDIEDTLFHRAILVAAAGPASNLQATQLLEEYVARADKDSRKLPEACYRLALLHGYRGPRHVGEAKRYFLQGQQADTDRLPVFKDEVHDWRDSARALVKRYEPCGNPACSSYGSQKCSACGLASYCSQECQRLDWCAHKAWCKKHRGKKKKKPATV